MLSRFEDVEVVKTDLYTPYIEKAEETVAELTYQKPLRFMVILCQILLTCE
jgi:DNA polymerase III alpha subunit (gram-positive type)